MVELVCNPVCTLIALAVLPNVPSIRGGLKCKVPEAAVIVGRMAGNE